MGGADLDKLLQRLDASSGVAVLTGPAGAGKTAVAMELYRRGADELGRSSCLLIAPNALAAQQARRRLLEASPAGVLAAPAVATFADLAWGIISAAGLDVRALTPVQRRLLLEGIVRELADAGRLRALAPLADTPGLIDALDAGIAELKRAAVAPEALAGAIDAKSGRHGDFLAVYQLYQQRLGETGRYDLEGRMWVARDVLAGDDSAALGFDNITALAVDGFTDFTPTQLEIIAILSRRLEQTLITLPLADQPGRKRMWFWTQRTLERILAAIPAAETVSLSPPDQPLGRLFDLSDDASAGTAPAVTIVKAPSVEAEVRAVARAVKADLAGGAPAGTVAVIARSLEPYAETIQRVFAAHDIPIRPQAGALAESNVVRYVAGLLALPGEYDCHDVLAAIRNSYFRPAALGDFDELTVTTAEMAIRAANVLGGRESYGLAFARLARLARGRAETVDGEDDDFTLGRLRADADAIERAGDMIEALLARLDRLADATDAPAYVAEVRRLIDELQVYHAACECSDDAIVAADLRALAAMDELLADVAAEASPTPAGGYAELIARCAAAAALPGAGGESLVTVADVLDARALRLGRVHLLGVNERAFPTLGAERCFIGEADRAAWADGGVILDRRSDMIAREMLLYYLAATRGSEALTVSYLASDASGKSHSPSVFVDELISAVEAAGARCARVKIAPGAFAPPTDQLASADDAFNAAISAAFGGAAGAASLLGWAAGRGRLLRRASFGLLAAHRRWAQAAPDAYDGRISDDELLASLTGRFPQQWTFSATEFNSYGRCPWQFFARYLLHLEALAEPAAQMTPAEMGVFCHSVLWRVMSVLRDRAGGELRLADVGEDDLRAALDEAVEAERDRLADRAVYSQLWAIQTQAWRNTLWAYLADQRAGAGEGRMLHFELGFGLAGAAREQSDPASQDEPVELTAGDHSIRLRGKIDRVDGSDAGPLAVDYKTGTVPMAKDILSGRDLQLALYAKALAAIFGPPTAGGAYHDVKRNKVTPATVDRMPGRGARISFEDWLAESMAAAGRCVDGMRGGRFDALPDGECTHYCPYRQICHFSPARARRKGGEVGQGGEDE